MPNIACIVSQTCKNRPQLSDDVKPGWPDPLECFHCYYLSTARLTSLIHSSASIGITNSTAAIVIHHNLVNTRLRQRRISRGIVLSDMQESTPVIRDDRYSV
ncbi:hypothetical protein J6590_038283 [Homalodisca vitripennis]|nr:hypothetical protein J6590_038283 [Homalodisca vitripennis]